MGHLLRLFALLSVDVKTYGHQVVGRGRNGRCSSNSGSGAGSGSCIGTVAGSKSSALKGSGSVSCAGTVSSSKACA
jgi:hypothetical protein